MSGYYDVEPDDTENWMLDAEPVIAAMKEQSDSRHYWEWDRIHVDLSGKDSDLTDYGYRGIEVLGADDSGMHVMMHAYWTFHDPTCEYDDCESEYCEQTDKFEHEVTYPWISSDTAPHDVRYDDMAAHILADVEATINNYGLPWENPSYLLFT